VQAAFVRALTEAKIPNPESRFEVVKPAKESEAKADLTSHLTLNTDLDAKDASSLLDKMSKSISNDPNLLFERLTAFGGAVAGETRTLALMAIVASWLIIIAYLWWRFHNLTYGLAAVIALVHDVLVTLGAVAISPYKIDLPMIAAFLTLIGFSVNDTIVIFDRIREIKGKTPYLAPEVINAAINQTLSRTILTSLTAWIVVVVMFFFGGEGLRGFSYCLVIGFLSGTYSTVYIATPILVDWVSQAPPASASKKAVAAAQGL
jgi:SecD/SecF fusion protein